MDYPGRVAADFPELLDIVRRLVKPDRDKNNRRERREKWWHFAEKCPALYHAIGRGQAFARHPEGWTVDLTRPQTILVCSEVTKFLAFARVQNDKVVSANADVFLTQSSGVFGVLQSAIHDSWARTYSARLETRLKYSPGNAFETYPFPEDTTTLQEIGASLYAERSAVMSQLGIGLTRLYNLVHSSAEQDLAFQKLRLLMTQCDCAVLKAYGWNDVNLEHDFHSVASLPANDRVRFTISETARLEVLRRLSELNRQRYQAEQDAARSLEAAEAERLAPRKRAGRPVAKKAAMGEQPRLFE